MKKSEAVQYFGTMYRLAKELGVAYGTVHKWEEDLRYTNQLAIERLTNGKLKATQPARMVAKKSV